MVGNYFTGIRVGNVIDCKFSERANCFALAAIRPTSGNCRSWCVLLSIVYNVKRELTYVVWVP